MAGNKIKFKVSIKELVFEFEGDQERGHILQGRITDTLKSLASAQSDVIDITPSRQLAAVPPQVIRTRRRSRARKPSPSMDQSQSNGDISSDDTLDGKPAKKRRPRGSSYRGQVIFLLNEGYFKIKRTSDEVYTELDRRGHNFPLYRIEESLLKLTKDKKLSRSMNADNTWEYESGATA